jgi:hypothetical protein
MDPCRRPVQERPATPTATKTEMSVCDAPKRDRIPAEDARIRAGTAIGLIELAAQVLENVPPPEVALPLGDRALYRYLQAAQAAASCLVGHGAGDGVDRPAPGSALGDGKRIYEWSEEETEEQFLAALGGWSEGQ